MESRAIVPFSAKKGGIYFTFAMISYVIFSFVFQAVLRIFFSDESFIFTALNSLIPIISLFGVSFLYSRNTNHRYFKVCKVKKFKPIYLFLAVLLTAGMFLGLGFVNNLIGDGLIKAGVNISTASLKMDDRIEKYLLLVLSLAVCPAIFEEFFFRGEIFRSLRDCNIWARILTVGLVFSLYHSNIIQLVYQFIFGVFLAVLVEFSKSVIPAIIAHFINNFVIITLEFAHYQINFYSGIVIAVGLFLLVLFVISIMFLNKKHKRFGKRHERSKVGNYILTKNDKDQEIGEFYGSAIWGIIICIFIILVTIFQ